MDMYSYHEGEIKKEGLALLLNALVRGKVVWQRD